MHEDENDAELASAEHVPPDSTPKVEPLTVEEREQLLARARAMGRELTQDEQRTIFDAPPPQRVALPPPPEVVAMQAAPLDPEQLALLSQDFYPELGGGARPPAPRLIQGVIIDFDDTLARLTRPLDELMAEGARAADAYMRASGMDLPDAFDANIVEARRFAEEKSEEENEEHLADDALSFLLQFFGYPASRMDPTVLHNAVDIFYAPEMTAWSLSPGAREMLAALREAGYRLALLANHNCDRVFQRTVDYLGVRDYFDVCLSSASVEYRKPDPRFLQIALDRWGAFPHEVIVAGDSVLHDVRAGLDLGAWTILVRTGITPQIAHDNERFIHEFAPDAVVDKLLEIPQLVETWSR